MDANIVLKFDGLWEHVTDGNGGSTPFYTLLVDYNDRANDLMFNIVPFVEAKLASGSDAEKLAALTDYYAARKALDLRRSNLAVYQARLASVVGGLLNDEVPAAMGTLATIPE